MEVCVMGFIVFSNNCIQLYNKNLYLIDKFKNTFRNNHNAVVFSFNGSSHNAVTDDTGKMSQGHAIGIIIYFFFFLGLFDSCFIRVVRKILADQGYISVSLQGNFKCQVTCNSSHNLADMPVFNIRAAVCTQITYLISKGPGSRMKAKRHGA